MDRNTPDLLGRDREAALLRAVVESRRSAVVVGEHGIGKSALLGTVTEGRSAAIGGCLAGLRGIPYLPLSRAVGGLLGRDPAGVGREVIERIGSGGLLIIDDLQWADDATLTTLERLVDRVSVLTAVRSGDADADAARAMCRAAGFVEVTLGPLDGSDSRDLAARHGPTLDAAAIRRLLAQAAGNPLLIEQLATAGVTTSLRLALAHRTHGLEADARDLLDLLAIVRGPVRLDAGRPGLDRLLDAGLAAAHGAGIGIRHTLIADAVEAELAADRRRSLHLTAARLVDTPAEAARHLVAGGAPGEAASVARRAAITAGSEAQRGALLAMAADATDAAFPGTDTTDLRLDAATALLEAGLFGDAERSLLAARPRSVDDTARLRWLEARAHWGVGRAAAAETAADEGRRLVAGRTTPLEADLAVEHAWIVTLRRDAERAVPLATAALATARSVGHGEAAALRTLATAMSIGGAPMDDWFDSYLAAVDMARTVGDTAEELLCGKLIVASHQGSGDLAEGRRLGERFVAQAQATGMVGWEQSLRATLLSVANDLGAFRQVVDDGELLLDEPIDPRIRAHVAGHVALALVDLGRFDAAHDHIRVGRQTAPDDVDGGFDLAFAAAELAAATGDPGRAVVEATIALGRFDGDAFGDLNHLRVTRDWAMLATGSPIPPPADPRGPVHPCWAGTFPERAGIAALATDDPSAAAEAFVAAIDAYAPFHRRGELRCRWALGEALRRAGRTSAAIDALLAVEVVASGHGAAPLVARIERSLRLAGERRSAPRYRSTGDGLTDRERQVLRLVGKGLTNIEIARQLGVGRPTVARTVSNAMTKLGVDSRAQVVARAVELE